MTLKYLEASKSSDDERWITFTHKFPWEGKKHFFRADPTIYADVTGRVEYNGSNVHSIPNVEYKDRKWIAYPSVIEVYRKCSFSLEDHKIKAPFTAFFTTNKKDKITVLISGTDRKLVQNVGRAALRIGNCS